MQLKNLSIVETLFYVHLERSVNMENDLGDETNRNSRASQTASELSGGLKPFEKLGVLDKATEERTKTEE